MKLLVVIVVLVIVGLYFCFMLSVFRARRLRRRRKAISRASWKPAHRSLHGETEVLVQLTGDDPEEELILETQIVDSIRDLDSDYEDRFLRAMDKARQRASTLNSEN